MLYLVSGECSNHMKTNLQSNIKDGAKCKVTGGTHTGKSGIVSDTKISKTGHVTITVTQRDGLRFKTLAKNIVRAR